MSPLVFVAMGRVLEARVRRSSRVRRVARGALALLVRVAPREARAFVRLRVMPIVR